MELVRYDAAKAALAECERIDEVKDWNDRAEALRTYAKQANDPELEYTARRIRARAAIRLGELSAALPKGSGGDTSKKDSGVHFAPKPDAPKPKKDVLAEAGVSVKTAQRAERLAALPVEEREEAIERDVPATLTELVGRASRHANRPKEPAVRPPADVAPGCYSVLLADPPWRYDKGAGRPGDTAEDHYPTMATPDICALPLPAIADDAALFLWATPPKIGEGLMVVQDWGFEFRSSAVWVKPSIGPGYWFRQRHELLLVGVRGKFKTPAPRARVDSVFEAPRGKHSEKPEAVQAWIEAAWPMCPKVELFARRPRAGWDVWGNETEVE